MSNLTNDLLSIIADGHDSVKPGLGDCARELIADDSRGNWLVAGDTTRHGRSLDFTIIQLAAIRRACLAVIDDQRWELYEGSRIDPGEVKVSISEEEATENRMRFVDAVQTTSSEMVWDTRNP